MRICFPKLQCNQALLQGNFFFIYIFQCVCLTSNTYFERKLTFFWMFSQTGTCLLLLLVQSVKISAQPVFLGCRLPVRYQKSHPENWGFEYVCLWCAKQELGSPCGSRAGSHSLTLEGATEVILATFQRQRHQGSTSCFRFSSVSYHVERAGIVCNLEETCHLVTQDTWGKSINYPVPFIYLFLFCVCYCWNTAISPLWDNKQIQNLVNTTYKLFSKSEYHPLFHVR